MVVTELIYVPEPVSGAQQPQRDRPGEKQLGAATWETSLGGGKEDQVSERHLLIEISEAIIEQEIHSTKDCIRIKRIENDSGR